MSKNNKIIVAAIIIAVILGIAYVFYVKPQTTQAPNIVTNESIQNQPIVTNKPITNASTSATVTYNGTSFSPTNVTIKQGGTVNFINKSVNPMWVASNPHPFHTDYDSTNKQTHCVAGYAGPKPFDECSSGASFSFTFSKIGFWGYHDHLNGNATGTVVVVQ